MKEGGGEEEAGEVKDEAVAAAAAAVGIDWMRDEAGRSFRDVVAEDES